MKRTASANRHPWLDGLRKLPILAGCTERELDAVAAAMTPVTVPAGRRLVDEGTVGREALIIEEGHAVVCQGGAEVAMLGPGDLVGEMAVLSRGRRCASVTAVTPLKVHDASAAEFRALLERAPGLRARVLATAAARGLTTPAARVLEPQPRGRWLRRTARA